MISTNQTELLGVARLWAAGLAPALVLEKALPSLRILLGVDGLAVRRTAPDGPQLVAWAGRRPESAEVSELLPTRALPGDLGDLLVLGPRAATDPQQRDLAMAVFDAVLAHAVAEEQYADLVARVDNAQHLAGMGDYDWHIPTDSNRWSDELYRIYGYEPQAFQPSYAEFLARIHPEDRERISAIHQEAYRTGEPYQMIERIVRPDGEVRYLSSNGEVVMDESGTPVRMRGTCIDITERVLAEREREEHAARLGEANLRRRQALEINDNVVQGLVAATYALDSGDRDGALSFLDKTLGAARAMMDDLLEPLDGEGLRPGELVRSTAASVGSVGSPRAEEQPDPETAGGRRWRVLVVDDADDLRLLLRTRLDRSDLLNVVGEAGDGMTAIELARQLQPDLVLLDLAMPRMDGLEALPHILSAAPGVRVLVLSGFNEHSLAEKALAAGADRYIVKGGSLRELVTGIEELLTTSQ